MFFWDCRWLCNTSRKLPEVFTVSQDMKQTDQHVCPGCHKGEAGGTSPFSSLTFSCRGKKWHKKWRKLTFLLPKARNSGSMVQGGTGDGWKEPKERRNQGGFVFNRKAYRQRKERTWVFPASLQVEQKGICGICLYDTRNQVISSPTTNLAGTTSTN